MSYQSNIFFDVSAWVHVRAWLQWAFAKWGPHLRAEDITDPCLLPALRQLACEWMLRLIQGPSSCTCFCFCGNMPSQGITLARVRSADRPLSMENYKRKINVPPMSGKQGLSGKHILLFVTGHSQLLLQGCGCAGWYSRYRWSVSWSFRGQPHPA